MTGMTPSSSSRFSSSHGFARSSGDSASELWNANRPLLMKSCVAADDARVLRLIQIQAARVVARAHAKTIEANALQGAARRQVHRIAPRRVVEIVHDRQQRLDQQRISSTAGMAIDERARFVALERFDRDDDERREGDEGDTEDASRRPVRRVAPSQPPYGPHAMAMKRAPAAAAQPDGRETQHRDERKCAGAEEAGDARHASECRADEQRDGEHAGGDARERGPEPVFAGVCRKPGPTLFCLRAASASKRSRARAATTRSMPRQSPRQRARRRRAIPDRRAA